MKLGGLCGCMAFSVVRSFIMPKQTILVRAAAAASAAANSHGPPAATAAASTTTTASTTTNPFLQMDDLPKFSSIQPTDLTPAVQTLLAQMEQDFVALEEKLSENDNNNDESCFSYDQILPEIERMQFPIGYVWGIAGHLNGVKNGDELRTAYEQNQPGIVQAFAKFSQSKPLYKALSKYEIPVAAAAAAAGETATADAHDDDFVTAQKKRAIALSLRGMKLGGVGLTGADQIRFNDIKMKLASLSTTFSNNVLDETKSYSLMITDVTPLQGVPESARALWAQAAGDGATAEKGPYKITLDMPSYIAVLSHVPDRNIRHQVYLANLSRAFEQNPDKNNIPLIREILTLKQEMAQLLGFDNYAELSLASKMAPSITAVRELSDLILQKALPAAHAELAAMTQLAHDSGHHPVDEPLLPWDTTYWSERLKESKYDLTEEETRPYFALPKVLEGMFALVGRLFQIEVEAADGEADVWHPDVRFFKVYDTDSGGENDGAAKKHIASFFLDPYSRPADKRGGAWMDVCIGKSAAVQRDIPVAYLTCNGSPPMMSNTAEQQQPSLMTFREVETLFHEFGHGLQHMLTKASVGDVAGINGTKIFWVFDYSDPMVVFFAMD
jgi:oligopeptidase A